MKAVNLIPSDQRGGGASARGTHVVLGALALVLVGVIAYVVTTNQISSRQDDLARAKQRSATVSSQLSTLKPYVDFATLKDSRTKTVHDLAAARFNWQRPMSDLSHVTTHQVWLTAMTATVAPGITLESAGTGSTSTLRSALPNPAVELSGCAVSNKAVVAYMSRLRAIKGVVRVTLDSAEKPSSASSSATSTSTGGSTATGGCGTGDGTPAFDAVVFFAPIPGATDTTGATATAPTTSTGTSTSTPTGSTSGTTSTTSTTSGSTR
ncbi:MAG TPA: PilN domain-containing protein [Solirubrobacteraceae bacterium]